LIWTSRRNPQRGGPGDLAELEHAIRDHGVRLVVVDPIVAAIDTKLDAHKDQHVRSVLGALRGLAEDTETAIAGPAT
jgi:AAA domain